MTCMGNIDQILVDPDGTSTSFVFDQWEADGGQLCNYNWTYKAYYEGIELHKSVLKELVEFKATDREFIFKSKTGN